jgi:hypothetical protein
MVVTSLSPQQRLVLGSNLDASMFFFLFSRLPWSHRDEFNKLLQFVGLQYPSVTKNMNTSQYFKFENKSS